MKVVVKYIVAVLLFIASVGGIFNSDFISGIFTLVLAFLVLPTISKKITTKFKVWQNNIVRYSTYAGILVLLGVFISEKPKQEVQEQIVENKQKSKPETKPNNISFSSDGEKTIQKTENKPTKSKVLKGIKPADIYLNFEKKGFKVDKQISSDGSFFYCTNKVGGIDYNVTIYCEDNINEVTSVRATATRIKANLNSVDDMKPFIRYASSIPYDKADINAIQNFIDNNYNNNKASIEFAGVKYVIYSPSEFMRYVSIGE